MHYAPPRIGREKKCGDCWRYGIEPNRPTLEALVTYMAEQGLIPKPIPIEQLFAPTFG